MRSKGLLIALSTLVLIFLGVIVACGTTSNSEADESCTTQLPCSVSI